MYVLNRYITYYYINDIKTINTGEHYELYGFQILD